MLQIYIKSINDHATINGIRNIVLHLIFPFFDRHLGFLFCKDQRMPIWLGKHLRPLQHINIEDIWQIFENSLHTLFNTGFLGTMKIRPL